MPGPPPQRDGRNPRRLKIRVVILTLKAVKGKDLLFACDQHEKWVPHPFAHFAKGWESTNPKEPSF